MSCWQRKRVPETSSYPHLEERKLDDLASMTQVDQARQHDAFAIVSALRQTRDKYIVDLGDALAKTNPILAITFSITKFSYAGIPPLAGFCSKFYLFFATLGYGAYFLAPVEVVTSIIGCWAAGRLPRVSQFGEPKAALRAPDM
ncbi:hypothetical protein CRYUN_Cryun19dG0078500 [Craigia yunnanensis]